MTSHKDLPEAISLLSALIATPSHSREEGAAADKMWAALDSWGLSPQRERHNVWCQDLHYREGQPTLLLCAHLDTVKPSDSWQRQPYTPSIEGDRLYGLGSNDCGGGLVTMALAFRQMVREPRPYNLLFLASAEEEVSGANGVEYALTRLPRVDVAMVGEPTALQPAVAEKGLMVLDLVAHGKSGHAAREEGVNAIYEALQDMEWIAQHRFEKVSPLLGATKMTLTMVNAGKQHNVIPDKCFMTVDVRTNELYTNEEVLQLVKQHVRSEVSARSLRLRSSHISMEHPLVKRCLELGLTPYGSPTLSDQALMSFPSFKLGPGESARSHTADEFVCVSELQAALQLYPQVIDAMRLLTSSPSKT